MLSPQWYGSTCGAAVFLLLNFVCGIAQCATPSESAAVVNAAVENAVAAHERIRERVTATFTRAAYLSPTHEAALGRSVWMAPLIVQELHLNGGKLEFPKFGAVRDVAGGHDTIDENRPTVYTTARRIRIHGRLYHQDSYVWFYASEESGTALRYRGFRQTLGRNGFPVVREIISDASTERIFFIGKSLESEAAKQFGAPLTDRQFAIEADRSKQPRVVVARVLPDGPQPMGPYVYVHSPSLEISNLKCRCEPAQANEFPWQGQYRLVSVPSFAKLNVEFSGGKDGILPDATQLEGVLRLPDSL